MVVFGFIIWFGLTNSYVWNIEHLVLLGNLYYVGVLSVVVNYLFKGRIVLPKVSGIVLDWDCQTEAAGLLSWEAKHLGWVNVSCWFV